MVHILHHVKSVGCMPLESLKIWLTEEEFKKCANSPYVGKTWYPLLSDVFIALLFRVIILLKPNYHLISCGLASEFAISLGSILMLLIHCHLQQEIGEASDDVARKYYDETPKEEWSDPAVTAAMRAAAKLKHHNFKGQFFKYLSIANPKFSNKFLEEVGFSLLIPLQDFHLQCHRNIDISWPWYRSRGIGATTRSLRCHLRSCSSLQRLL